jgi:hypothetical protein
MDVTAPYAYMLHGWVLQCNKEATKVEEQQEAE